MTKKLTPVQKAENAAHREASKKTVKEIKGPLVFQRSGQVAVFKALSDEVLSNTVVQFMEDILPKDYTPQKYEVSGEFVYKIFIAKKD